MIVGDKTRFAIEFEILKTYEGSAFRALGFFVLYLNGERFGVYAPDATFLECAVDQAARIISERGRHGVPFAAGESAEDLLEAVYQSIYAEDPKEGCYFGLRMCEIAQFVQSSGCEWYRRCDEAFDDGSVVLNFDLGNKVRLIASSPRLDGAPTLVDLWIDAEDFYEILARFVTAFAQENDRMTKAAY